MASWLKTRSSHHVSDPIMATPQPQLANLRLLSVNITPLKPGGWVLRGAVNAAWSYYMNDQPGAVVRQGTQRFALDPGQLMLIPPACRYDADTTVNVRHLWGYFFLHGLPSHRLRGLESPILVPQAAGDELFPALFATEGITVRNSLRLAARLLEAVAEILPQELQKAAGPEERRLQPALDLIADAYTRSVANRELAAACGLSTSHFQRNFRRVTGTSPAQAMLARRLRAAAQALLESDADLETIARRCGFGNRTYLSRVFRAGNGLSPTRYRQQNRRSG